MGGVTDTAGQAAGHKAGHDVGHNVGHEVGHGAGQAAGHDVGGDVEHGVGHDVAHDVGQEAGRRPRPDVGHPAEGAAGGPAVYDYVVVGAGSAGCALAARLSEDPDVRVCLVEAGPADTDPDTRVPLFGGRLLRTHLDWDYDSHDEPGLDGRRVYLPRGRVVGGSSALNGMVYIRGNALDYDAWEQPGWTWADMLPYFLRSEDNERGASAYHATGGPLAVGDGRADSPAIAAFVNAAEEAGHERTDDFNGPRQDGFGRYQVTMRDGERCSSADAFLRPAARRANLTVLTHVQVHRVTFAGTRATGVTGRRLDDTVELRAEREVLLCAGAYNSPQLLLLSGVGAADDLRALGVPVVADLPQVGRNLQDHPSVNLVWTHTRPEGLFAASEDRHVREYAERRRGPLASNVPEGGGFLRSDPALPAPDLQYHAAATMLVDGGLGAPTAHGFSFGPCLLTPRSRGDVTLVSAAPTAKPRIRHAYYREDADLQVMVAGVRAALEIAARPALAPYAETPFRPPASWRDGDLRDYVRRNTQTLFHPSGTCAMGTVVDAELRVHGVTGLRVVDTSVMPTVVRGNTNAPVIALAERAADLIRGAGGPAERAGARAAPALR